MFGELDAATATAAGMPEFATLAAIAPPFSFGHHAPYRGLYLGLSVEVRLRTVKNLDPAFLLNYFLRREDRLE